VERQNEKDRRVSGALTAKARPGADKLPPLARREAPRVRRRTRATGFALFGAPSPRAEGRDQQIPDAERVAERRAHAYTTSACAGRALDFAAAREQSRWHARIATRAAHSQGDDMVRFADRLLIACCATLLSSLAAHAAPQLSMYLKNYYADYQIVEDCSNQAQLTATDAQTAKDAMAKIEAYYLHRDASINKDRVLKQAVSNKNAAYKMMKETNKVDPRQFCRASLNDLVSKLHEIDAHTTPKKSGS
jgi:hypothetical protein